MQIIIEHDQDADFSAYSAKEQARGLVALEVTIYADADRQHRQLLASLSNITFYESDDWTDGEFASVEAIPAGCDYLREVAQRLLKEAGDEDDGECPHCGSRNTAPIACGNGEQECHDCGKTFEDESAPDPATAFLLCVQGEDSPIGVYSTREKAVAEGDKLREALGITYQAVEYIIDHTY